MEASHGRKMGMSTPALGTAASAEPERQQPQLPRAVSTPVPSLSHRERAKRAYQQAHSAFGNLEEEGGEKNHHRH